MSQSESTAGRQAIEMQTDEQQMCVAAQPFLGNHTLVQDIWTQTGILDVPY